MEQKQQQNTKKPTHEEFTSPALQKLIDAVNEYADVYDDNVDIILSVVALDGDYPDGELVENRRMLIGHKKILEFHIEQLREALAKDTDHVMFHHEFWFDSTEDSLRRLKKYHEARSLPEEVPMLPGNSSIN